MSGLSWKLAGYVIEAPLGSGASARVWRARTAATDEVVALKRIVVRDVDQVRAARVEAALLATLEHPHLIRLHHVVPSDNAIVLVLDYAPGGSLAELLQRRGRLTPGEVITAIAPIGAALAYAHGAGVVHADVSPSNILFSELGLPMLADLGVARLFGDDAPIHATPAYVDPTVARGGIPGQHSDVFMLAGCALHALTGVALWSDGGVDDVFAAALVGDVSHAQVLLQGVAVPQDVCDVVLRGLSVDAERRGTAAEFALDLRYAAEPRAVELHAGRLDVAVRAVRAVGAVLPEHAAGLLRQSYRPDTDVGPEAPEHAAVPGRPAFAGPATPMIASNPAITHTLAARPRPAVGGHRRGRPAARATRSGAGRLARITGPTAAGTVAAWARIRGIRWRSRPARWVVAIAGLCAVVAGGGIAWALGPGEKPGRPAAIERLHASSQQVAIPELGVTPPTDGAVSAASGETTAAQASAILSQLDALREQAYARRAPVLLTGVYTPGVLLNEDTASLEHLVPVGCGLQGVHAVYAQVTVTFQDSTTLDISAQTTLPASVLFCDGTAKAQAPGSGPTVLHLGLTKSGAHYLIQSIAR